eukprot:scaffold2799_cov159-Ochromonas_danica.AAC.29
MSGIADPRQEAISYMEQKNVFKLFDFLGAQLAKEKPEDPNDFLLSELRRIARLKEAGKPVTLFSKEDIDIMFTTFDITNRGYVTAQQYEKALTAVGVKVETASLPTKEKIDREAFVTSL